MAYARFAPIGGTRATEGTLARFGSTLPTRVWHPGSSETARHGCFVSLVASLVGYALLASGCPASFSRIAIGALSGAARLERRMMKVCSSAY